MRLLTPWDESKSTNNVYLKSVEKEKFSTNNNIEGVYKTSLK